MAYTPGVLFAFRGEPVPIPGGGYTPGPVFAPEAAPVSVSIGQAVRAVPFGSPEFLFAGIDYTPGTAFGFFDPGLFRFIAQDYTPGPLFQFPWWPATGEAPAIPEITGVIEGVLEDLTGAFIGINVAQIGILSGTLDGVTGAFVGAYEPNVHRWTLAELCSNQEASGQITVCNPLLRIQAIPGSIAIRDAREAATDLREQTHCPIDRTEPVGIESCARIDEGTRLSGITAAAREQLTPVHIKRCGTADDSARIDAGLFSVLYQLELIRPESRSPVDDAGQTQHEFLRRFYDYDVPGANYRPGTVIDIATLPEFDDGRVPGSLPESYPFVYPFVLADAGYTPSAVFAPDYWPPSADTPRPGGSYQTPVFSWPGSVSDRFDRLNDQLGGVRHQTRGDWQSAQRFELKRCAPVDDARRPPPGTSPWVDHPRPPPVQPPGQTTVDIPDKRAYIMQHSLSVTLMDLTPVPMDTVSINYNADSFAWQFSGQLAGKAALPLVQQTPGQPPVQLIVTVNGYSWKVLVERIEHGRQFAKRTINLSGRGLTALLGQPYEQPASANQGSDLTVQQIADLQLPPGWTNNWTCATWLVPGGAYSYSQQTPIQALAGIANAIGAMLVPSRDSQVINIMPRYPVLPWDFDLATPDVTIPEAAIFSLSQRPVIPYQANGVYVHGGEIGGVLGWCRLNGTAGDRLAPTVSNQLITDVTGARALGERILAGQYEQPGIQSITLPMDGIDIPLIEAGQLAEITLDGSPVRGIVNAVSIEASLASVRQTIQIGEETPNTWALFKELLPTDPLLAATLSNTDGTTSLMALLDGGVVRVRGTGTVGNKYYIRSGKIDGDAPDLVQSEIVI